MMKDLLRILYVSILTILFSFSVKSQTNQCLKIGMNVGGPNRYNGTYNMFKDVMKSSTDFYTPNNVNNYSYIPTDENGYPNAGLPTTLDAYTNAGGFSTFTNQYIQTLAMQMTSQDFPWGAAGTATDSCGLYTLFWEGEGTIDLTYNKFVVSVVGVTSKFITSACGTITTSGTSFYLGTKVPNAGIAGASVRTVTSTNMPGLHYIQFRIPNGLNMDSRRGIELTIRVSSPAPNHIRNIALVYPNARALGTSFGINPDMVKILPSESYNAFADPQNPEFYLNKPFNPMYLNWYRGFKILRMMSAMGANGIDYNYDVTWTKRRPKGYYSQSEFHDGKVGVSMAYEWLIDIANETKSDIWINASATGDVNHYQQMAKMFHQTLDPSLNIYMELGNEQWNYAGGFNTFFVLNNYATTNNLPGGVSEASAIKEGQLWKAFFDEYGIDSTKCKRVMSGFAGNPDVTRQKMAQHQKHNQNWDYFSTTWYFSNSGPLGGAEKTYWGGINDITGTYSASSTTPVQYNAEAQARIGTPAGSGGFVDEIISMTNMASNYKKKVLGYEGGLGSWEFPGRTQEDPAKMAKFDASVRQLYQVVLDTIRNHPEIEAVNQFADFGGSYGGPQNGGFHGYGAMLSVMTDTSATGNGTYNATFGPYNFKGTNKHGVWKELLAQQYKPSICEPQAVSDNKGPGNALEFNSAKYQYIDFISATNPNGTSDYSYELWVKPEDANKTMDLIAFTDQANSSLNVLRIDAGNRINWIVNNTAGSSVVNLTGSLLTMGNWYHLAAVKQGNNYKLYLNGTIVASSSGTGTYSSNRINMGASIVNSGVVNNYFKGQLDELRIWNGASVSTSAIRNYMCKKLNVAHPFNSNLSNYIVFNSVTGANLFDLKTGTYANNALHNFSLSGVTYYVTSGAPIGDESITIYPGAWAGATLTYTNPIGGDIIQISGMGGGLPDGAHLYVVNDAATLNAMPNYYTSVGQTKFYGVFMANGVTPGYDIKYFYVGNPGASPTDNFNRLIKRGGNSDPDWVNGAAVLDKLTKSLTINCRETYRSEYNIGVRQSSLEAKPGSGYAISFNTGSLTGGGGFMRQFYRTNDYTISFWAYNHDGSGGNVVWFGAPNGGAGGWQGGGDNMYAVGGGSLSTRFNGLSFGNGNNGVPSGAVGNWNHYAITKEGSALNLYINGTLNTSGVDANQYFFSDMHIASPGVEFSSEFSGDIDEMSVWSKALTQTQLRDLMCKKITPSHPEYCNLKAYFRFDQGAGSIIENEVGSGDMVLTGGTWVRSGAALGNESAYNYAAPYGVTMTHPDGDAMKFEYIVLGAHQFGTQFYRVDEAPVYTGTVPSGITSMDNSRYWGVFDIGQQDYNTSAYNMNYKMTYSYAANKNIILANESTLTAIDRKQNDVMNWNLFPTVKTDISAKTITIMPEAYTIAGVNSTDRTITIPGHGFNTCDMISYYYEGPTGMYSQNAQYHVSVIGPNLISLHNYYNVTDCATGLNPAGVPAFPAGTQYFIKVNTFKRDEVWIANTNASGFVNTTLVPTISGIVGKSTVCQGEAALTYRIKNPVDYNATQFIWTGSAGLAVGISNKDTVSVNIIASGPSIETLSVVGVNKNGRSTPTTIFTITVKGTGNLSADISGAFSVCAPNTNVPYSISGVSPVPISYFWSVTGVASINGPSTGSAIQLDFDNNPGNVILSVYGSYSCGNALINTMTIKNNKAPNVDLPVAGDTVCSSYSSLDPHVTIYASEIGVQYLAYDITSTPTFVGSVTGSGGPVQITYPRGSLADWSTRTIQIKASNNPCAIYTLNNNAYILMSNTLTGTELSGVLFNGPTVPACYAGNGINIYSITLTGTRAGVTYAPYVFDYNQNYPYYEFQYILGENILSTGNQTVLEVKPATFIYWYSFTRPNTIGGMAMAPGCPSQKLPNSYNMQLKRSTGVAVSSKVAGYPIGLRESADDDVYRGYCSADNGKFFTTAWGGNADVFIGRELFGKSIAGNPNITITSKSINLADVDVGDVLFTISSVGEPASYGFNLNGIALYVISKNFNSLQVSASLGGPALVPGTSITDFRFWAPVTIPQITSGSQTITIPTKYANHNLRLYSQVTFSNASGLTTNLPSPVNGPKVDLTYYIASIIGNNFILSRMETQWTAGQEKSLHYNVEKGTISVTNGSNLVAGYGTRFGQNLYGGFVIQAGDILRDENDALIGIVSTVYNSTSLGLADVYTGVTRSGITYGFMRPQTYGNSSLGTSAKSVVLTAPTDAWDGSVTAENGFDWQVTPIDAITSIIGLGGTYLPLTGEYIDNATPLSSGVNTAAGEGYSARVKNSITVLWNQTFAGNAYVAVRSKNQCGVTVYDITEAYTPGYERTQVRVNVRAKIPGIPDSINFPPIPLCKSAARSILTTSAKTSGGYQWQLLNAGTSSLYLPFYSCGGCQYDQVSTVPGAKVDGGSCATNPGVRDDCVQNGGTAGINWASNFTGIATVRVRAYGCDQVTASPWVTTNITISGSLDVTANISGQNTICASPGVPNQYTLNPTIGAIDSQTWFLLPGSAEDIYSGLIGYYPMDNLTNGIDIAYNQSISPQSLGSIVNMTEANGSILGIANALGMANKAANFGGGGPYFNAPANKGYDFTNELTLSAWVNYTDDNSDNPYIIFSKGNRYQNADCCGQNPAGSMMIGLGRGTAAGDDRKLVVYWDDLISTQETSLDNPITGDTYGDNKTIAGIVSNVITPGVWHHVALTIKPIANNVINVIAYVDGAQSGPTLTVPGKFIPPIFPDEERIGGMKNSGHNFKGLMDELALYNRALTLAEIQALKSVTGLLITDPNDAIGDIGVTSGLLTWVPTFTGTAKIVSVPTACGGDARPVYYTVNVMSQPSVTGIAFADPTDCAPGSSGSVLVTLSGFTGAANSLFDLDLNGGGYGGSNGKIGTISGISIVSVTSGLPAGYTISQVRIRQKGNLCNAAPDPTYISPERIITGGQTPSAAVPATINSINSQCSNDNAIVRLTGSENAMLYYAKIGTSVVTSTVAGTGSILDLSITGAGLLTSSGLNTTYTVKIYAVNPGCTVVGLTAMPVITVNGPSLPGTISGNNPVCSGNNSLLTLSGYNGTLQWIISTNSGSSFMNTGVTSDVYATTPLTSATLFSALVTNGACSVATATGITISVNGTSLAGTISGVAPLCSGNSLVLSLTGYYGIPQWQSSTNGGTSWSNVSGSSSYSTGALTTTTTYRVIVMSGVCLPATVSGANIIVSPVPVAGSLIGGGNVITLSGTTGSITLSGQTGSILGWQKRLNAGAYIDISGTSGLNPFSETPTAAGLWEYRSVIQSGVCTTVASAPVMVTVVGVGGTVTLVAPNLPTVCINSSTQLTLTGYSGSIIRWEVSTNSGVSWISIANTIDVLNYVSLNVATNWQFRGVVTGNQYSGAQTIVVSPLTNAGNISPASQTICNNTGTTLTLTGFTPSITKWIYSDDGGTTWTDFANAGVSIISTGNLTANRMFEAIVQSPGCSVLTTTSLLVSVSGASQAGTALADGTPVSINKYAGSYAVLSLTTMTGTLLDWKSGTSALGPFSTSLGTTGTITGLTAGSLYYVAIVQNGGSLCTTAQSVPVQINVNNAVMVASFTGGNIALCISNASASGVSFTDLSSAASQGPVLGWLWNFDGGVSANGNNVSNPGIIRWTTPGVKTILLSITGFATPSTFTQVVTIDGVVAFGTLSANYLDICEGSGIQSINLTVTSSPVSSTISYQQSTDNLFTSPFTLSAGSGVDPGPIGVYYFRAMGINGTCSIPGYSGMVTVSVTAPINPGSSISYNGGLPLCSDATGLFPASGITTVPGGVFTFATQLYINASTGSLNVASSTGVSNGFVNYAIPNLHNCGVKTVSGAVTITPKPDASIDYAVKSYCNNYDTDDIIPILSQPGVGSFSSIPIGLVDASTGHVFPAGKTSGLYKIFYSIAPGGGCTSSSVGTVPGGFTLTAAPSVPGFAYVNLNPYGGDHVYCKNSLFAPTPSYGIPPTGGSYLSNSSNLVFTDASSGEVNLVNSRTGSYQVTYMILGSPTCKAVSSALAADITINTAPEKPVFGFGSSSYCSNGNKPAIVNSNTLTGGFYSSDLASRLEINGGVVYSIMGSGLKTVYYTVSVPGCDPTYSRGEASFTYTEVPAIPGFIYDASEPEYTSSVFCTQGGKDPITAGVFTGGTFSYANLLGDTISKFSLIASTGHINLGKSDPGVWQVSYVVPEAGGCKQTPASFVLTVTSSVGGKITANVSQDGICEGSQATLLLSDHRGNIIKWYEVVGTKLVQIPQDTNSTVITTSTLSGKTHYFRALVSNGFCNADTSAIETVKVSTMPIAGAASVFNPEDNKLSSSVAVVCQELALITLTGYTGSIQWQMSSDSSSIAWDNVTNNATATTKVLGAYGPAGTSTSTHEVKEYFKAKVVNGACTTPAYSNWIKVAKCRQDLYIPNALTPNSGDNNSVWDISKLRLTSNAEVKIFNRYGTVVYSASGDKMDAWDGGSLAAGTYYYVIEFNDGIVPKKTGAVTIIK